MCVRILYVSSNYRDIVFLGNAPIPKYKAPWHTRHHAERMSDDELAAIACQGGEDPLAAEEDEEILQPVELGCTASSRRRTIVC